MSVVTQDDLVRLFSYFARYPDSGNRGEDGEVCAYLNNCLLFHILLFVYLSTILFVASLWY